MLSWFWPIKKVTGQTKNVELDEWILCFKYNTSSWSLFVGFSSPCFQRPYLRCQVSVWASDWSNPPMGVRFRLYPHVQHFPMIVPTFSNTCTLRRNQNENAARVPGSTLDSSTSGSLGASVPMGFISPIGWEFGIPT